MKILVIGGGGREHALVWKLKQSPIVEKLWCAPGNGGIAAQADLFPADTGDVSAIVELARTLQPDLTVVGPELPLVNGLADRFHERGWPIVGPSRQAAQLEGSKIFSKQFLQRHQIPTAQMYGAYESAREAYRGLGSVAWPVVIKADGLCSGKGVSLAASEDEARVFIDRVMEKNELGPGGNRILMEETLTGEELSFIIITDGTCYAPLAPTRDHKRIFDGNRGPNTGGMGAYSTDDLLTESLRTAVISKIVEPTLRGLATDGITYQGFLYFGLMLTKSGPQVLEFNCRLGDPETQPIVRRMDFDLAEVLGDTAAGELHPQKLVWKPGASICVVLASKGYPERFETGKAIRGLTALEGNTGVNVFHAGTRLEGRNLITSGGRVLGVTSHGPTLQAARSSAYAAAAQIQFNGVHYRRDIGAPLPHLTAAVD